MKVVWAWVVQPGIAKRIALAMILSLVAGQAQLLIQLAAFAPSELRLTGTRWLAETTADIAHAAFTAPPGDRAAILQRIGRTVPAAIGWTMQRPTWPGDPASPVTQRLAATVRALTGAQARTVEVTLAPLRYGPPVGGLPVAVVPQDVVSRLGTTALRADEDDVLLPASVRVAVQGTDGSWISVAPASSDVDGSWFKTLVIALAADSLIVAVLSALAARWIMAPPHPLLRAANHIGGSLGVVPGQRTDLAALLISHVAETAADGRQCSYDGPAHAELLAHPAALERAFSNLIDNAVKYGGAARVTLSERDGDLLVHVADDGPGIPAHLVEDAFAPFHRLDQARGDPVPGAGLGLTVARDVVRSHGGTILLGCHGGQGLLVVVALPSGPSPQQPAGSGHRA